MIRPWQIFIGTILLPPVSVFGLKTPFFLRLCVFILLCTGLGHLLSVWFEAYWNSLLVQRYKQSRDRFDFKESLNLLSQLKLQSVAEKKDAALMKMDLLHDLGEQDLALKQYVIARDLLLPLNGKSVVESVLSTFLPASRLPWLRPGPKNQALQEIQEVLDYAVFLEQDPNILKSLLDRALTQTREATPNQIYSLEMFILFYFIRFEPEKIKLMSDSFFQDGIRQSVFHLKAFDLRGRYYQLKGLEPEAVADYLHIFNLDTTCPEIFKRLLSLISDPAEQESLRLYAKAEYYRFVKHDFSQALKINQRILHRRDRVAVFLRKETLFNSSFILRHNLKRLNQAEMLLDQLLNAPGFRKEEALYAKAMCQLGQEELKECRQTLKTLLNLYPANTRRLRCEFIVFYLDLRLSVDWLFQRLFYATTACQKSE